MNRRSKRGMSTPLVILMICLLALTEYTTQYNFRGLYVEEQA